MNGKKDFLLIQLMEETGFDEKDFVKELNKAADWVQVSSKTWLVWTGRSPSLWHNRIKPALRGDQSCLIIKSDLSIRAGKMPSSFWEFIKKKLLLSEK